MISQITEKIELKFWDVCIPLLSKSERLGRTVRQVQSIIQNEDLLKRVAIIALIACAGAATGMLAFSISLLVS
jgi:hypothetical protein